MDVSEGRPPLLYPGPRIALLRRFARRKSRAALEFMLKANKQPDIIHCHDWQTGLVPVLLYEIYQHLEMRHPRVCYTLHNLHHQGVTREHTLRATGLNRPAYFFHQDRLQDNCNPAALNLMKGGIVYSNFVTTVSPHYAWEIMNTAQDFGLGRTLQIHRGKVGGILNAWAGFPLSAARN